MKPADRSIRIFVADDRRLCRECLRLLIESIDSGLDVIEAKDAADIDSMLLQYPGPGVVLYNLVITDGEGIRFVRDLAASTGDIPLVVMCDSEDAELMRGCLENGARAFLPSTVQGPVLVAILRLVLAGGIYAPPGLVLGQTGAARVAAGGEVNARRELAIAANFPLLTPRQRHVLALLSQGLSNRHIAETLGMCENTVKAHVKQVMRKLGADNRTQAALMADRLVA